MQDADRYHEIEIPVLRDRRAVAADHLDLAGAIRGVGGDDGKGFRRFERGDMRRAGVQQHVDDPAGSGSDVRDGAAAYVVDTRAAARKCR